MCDSSLRSLCSEMQEENNLQAGSPESLRAAPAEALENPRWEEGEHLGPRVPAQLRAPLAAPAAGTSALSHPSTVPPT